MSHDCRDLADIQSDKNICGFHFCSHTVESNFLVSGTHQHLQ